MTLAEIEELKEDLGHMKQQEERNGPHIFTPCEHKYFAVVTKLLDHVQDLEDELKESRDA